jgi:hypothetical protein
MVITERTQLAGCVGQVVTLRGMVTRTKIPTILGVDVDAGFADQLGEATGTLAQYTVAPQLPGEPIRAQRSPGTYYALHDGAGLAKARPIK